MNDYVHEISSDERARIQRFLYILTAGTIAFVILIVVAIVTAKYWLRLIEHESERRFAEPYVNWTVEHVLAAGDPVLQGYVDELGRNMAFYMDLPPQLELDFYVLEGPTINAFTTLGGYIFVFEGVLQKLDNENGLAMVLAHEIAHARNRDPLLSASRGVLLEIMISTLSGSRRIDPAAATDIGAELMLNVYSREQESAADALALQALQRQYGHVAGATQLFRQLDEEYGEAKPPALLSSHPHLDERIDDIAELADERGWSVGVTTPYPDKVVEVLTSLP